MCRVLMHWFVVVQVHRTSSNLLELHHCRESKVCRVLLHEFGVVRLYRTFSNYIFRGEAICAGCKEKCSVLHWLDLKFGEFHKSTAFECYGVKTK